MTQFIGSIFIRRDAQIEVHPKIETFAVKVGGVHIHLANSAQARHLAQKLTVLADRADADAQDRRGHPDA